MEKALKREVWQRGPIENIPWLLQPVAHALLQASEEVNEIMRDFPETDLWKKPAEIASAGFHLQHLAGVLDRLFTYAEGGLLNEEQLTALSAEGKDAGQSPNQLVELFNKQVDKAVMQLSNTREEILKEPRFVGRAKIPSTVIGLLVHAAEHTMRHVGQLYVTVKFVRNP